MRVCILFLVKYMLLYSCISEKNNLKINEDNYWFQGKAEISNYQLNQARYGQMHKGNAVLIYVTEPFSEKSFSKADIQGTDDVTVLKLNFTKNFSTGIYPYSMMTSTFFPFYDGKNALKVSSSSQEWCGHTYMEMKPNQNTFEFDVKSYFQNETNTYTTKKTILEDDIWSIIRLNHKNLPIGKNLQIIPSFFYLRLKHKPVKPYPCNVSLASSNEYYEYKLSYPTLNREILIRFNMSFPYQIVFWSESYPDGVSNKTLTTTAVLKKSVLVDYWNKNKTNDTNWKKKLGL